MSVDGLPKRLPEWVLRWGASLGYEAVRTALTVAVTNYVTRRFPPSAPSVSDPAQTPTSAPASDTPARRRRTL